MRVIFEKLIYYIYMQQHQYVKLTSEQKAADEKLDLFLYLVLMENDEKVNAKNEQLMVIYSRVEENSHI